MSTTRVLKRSSQACENCRRKKTKCPSEQPSCSSCSRLGQICRYANSRDDAQINLARRLSRLEERMNLMATISHTPNSTSLVEQQLIVQPITPNSRQSFDIYPATLDSDRRINTLPHESVLEHAVEVYFRHCHKQPLWLFGDRSEIVTIEFNEVMQMILALALCCDSSFRTRANTQSPEVYADAARTISMLSISKGSVSVITLQCLCLLSFYNYTANDLHLARLHLGLTQSLLQQSSLDNRPFSTANMTEEAKQLYWSVHVLELICAPAKRYLDLSDSCQSRYVHHSESNPRYICIGPDLPRGSYSQTSMNTTSIWACLTQMLGVWKLARDYVGECAEGWNESPWTPTSTYISICSRMSDIECSLPNNYRYKNAAFHEKSIVEIKQRQLYWLQWFNMQITYHAIHAVLNHPFLYAQQASKHKRGPNMFWKNSSELSLLHSVWIARLIGMANEKHLTIFDPQVRHCAAIAATLHLYHSRTTDKTFNNMAQANLKTCQEFVRQPEPSWPVCRQLEEDLDSLIQQSIRQEQETSRTKLSFNTSLMWAIIGYSPPSSYRSTKGLFHESFSVGIERSVENDTTLRPANHGVQAVELCRPDRNVATSPTWSHDGMGQNDTQDINDDHDSSRTRNGVLAAPLLTYEDDCHTLLDTDFSNFPHPFDLDGADFEEWGFGTL